MKKCEEKNAIKYEEKNAAKCQNCNKKIRQSKGDDCKICKKCIKDYQEENTVLYENCNKKNKIF